MGANRPSDLQSAQEIDAICDRFEAVWKRGKSPLIEEYLKQVEKSHQ